MDHLPECPAPLCDYFDPKGKCMGYEDCEHLCCCAALRACEQRVNSSNLTMWDRTQEQAQQMVTSGLGIAWKDGFKEGINAAREAVDALIGWQHGIAMTAITKADALAAIDALKEET